MTPIEYNDRVDYSAVRASRNARRDGDGRPVPIRGRVLLEENAQLLRDGCAVRLSPDKRRHSKPDGLSVE